jgi:23S rRNA (pseudouridine1915-N3)-methyltransferase
MLAIDCIAVGKLRNGPLLDLFEEYRKRLTGKFALHEIDDRSPAQIASKIDALINPRAALVVLDERGKTIDSRAFAAKLDGFANTYGAIQFFIGGADGHAANLREKSTMLLSFGAQTWPHMLARVMLMEQIYRAQQILAGHPYHRD